MSVFGNSIRGAKKTAAHKPERFERFWKFYPRGENKQGAIRAWDRLGPTDELIDRMAKALIKQKQSEDWQRGIGIPHASTWLNNRRWEDEVKPPEETPPATHETASSDARGGLEAW